MHTIKGGNIVLVFPYRAMFLGSIVIATYYRLIRHFDQLSPSYISQQMSPTFTFILLQTIDKEMHIPSLFSSAQPVRIEE